MENLLKRRVRERLTALGKNPFEAARDADLSREFINDILIDKKLSVRGPGLNKLANALKVPVDYLLSESFELSDDERPDRRKDVYGDEDGDKISVKQLDIRFGMGGGAIYDLPVEAQSMSFSKAWIRQFTTAPVEHLFWASGFGDSMYPTIGDGDLVLVDQSQRTPRIADQVWALNQYGQGMIKRLRATADGYAILSDNPQVPAASATDGSMEIVGRVVAIVRRI